MDKRLTRILYGSYAGIVVALIGGAVTMPSIFTARPQRGISLWGSYFPAVVPYSIGFTIAAVCMLYAAYVLPNYSEQLVAMRRLLIALAFGFAFVLLTPAGVNSVFYWVHAVAALYMFVVAGLGAIWIMLRDDEKSGVDRALFWILIVGSVASLLSAPFVHVLSVLAIGQVLALNAGALIVVRAALRWSSTNARG